MLLSIRILGTQSMRVVNVHTSSMFANGLIDNNITLFVSFFFFLQSKDRMAWTGELLMVLCKYNVVFNKQSVHKVIND